jgi:hypothetical protein
VSEVEIRAIIEFLIKHQIIQVQEIGKTKKRFFSTNHACALKMFCMSIIKAIFNIKMKLSKNNALFIFQNPWKKVLAILVRFKKLNLKNRNYKVRFFNWTMT